MIAYYYTLSVSVTQRQTNNRSLPQIVYKSVPVCKKYINYINICIRHVDSRTLNMNKRFNSMLYFAQFTNRHGKNIIMYSAKM